MILKKKRPMRMRPIRVGCAFCWQWVPEPKRVEAHSPNARGGICDCGVAFIVDEVGRMGGQALMDALTLACDGDLDRATQLENDIHYEARTKPVDEGPATRRTAPGPVHSGPQVWFVKLKSPPPE